MTQLSTFTIRHHWLVAAPGTPPVRRVETDHVGGTIVPRLALLHDTAGQIGPGSAVTWLKRNPNQVSAHIVVERDGTIVQMAPFNRRTNHAGRSSWQGREHCNSYAIGIEIVAPGLLDARGAAWFGVSYAGAVPHPATDHHPAGHWLPYEPAQLAAVDAILAALGAAYETIEDVAGHYEVSPGRKVDPSPLLDMTAMRAALRRRPRVVVPAGSTPDEIKTAQQRLAALGYPAGIADGVVGPRLRGAVLAFQDVHGLPATGALDRGTLVAIAREDALPMPLGAREDATEADLVGHSRTIAATRSGTLASDITAAGAAIAAIATAITGLGQQLREVAAVAGIEVVVGAGCAVLVGYALYNRFTLGRIAAYRVDDHRTGRHLG